MMNPALEKLHRRQNAGPNKDVEAPSTPVSQLWDARMLRSMMRSPLLSHTHTRVNESTRLIKVIRHRSCHEQLKPRTFDQLLAHRVE